MRALRKIIPAVRGRVAPEDRELFYVMPEIEWVNCCNPLLPGYKYNLQKVSIFIMTFDGYHWHSFTLLFKSITVANGFFAKPPTTSWHWQQPAFISDSFTTALIGLAQSASIGQNGEIYLYFLFNFFLHSGRLLENNAHLAGSGRLLENNAHLAGITQNNLHDYSTNNRWTGGYCHVTIYLYHTSIVGYYL